MASVFVPPNLEGYAGLGSRGCCPKPRPLSRISMIQGFGGHGCFRFGRLLTIAAPLQAAGVGGASAVSKSRSSRLAVPASPRLVVGGGGAVAVPLARWNLKEFIFLATPRRDDEGLLLALSLLEKVSQSRSTFAPTPSSIEEREAAYRMPNQPGWLRGADNRLNRSP